MLARICPTFVGMFILDTTGFVDKLIRTLDSESYMSGSVSDPTRQLRTSVTHNETTSNKVVPASSNESRREVRLQDICSLSL